MDDDPLHNPLDPDAGLGDSGDDDEPRQAASHTGGSSTVRFTRRPHGHAKRLHEYVQFRKTQERKALMVKIAFKSEEYDKQGIYPGSGLWPRIGEHRAMQNKKYREVINGRKKREVTTPLGVKINIPPTLCLGGDRDNVMLHTDSKGNLCRTDFATARYFKTLQRRDMAVADEGKLRVFDPPASTRSFSSTAGHLAHHEGLGRFATPFGWQPDASDEFPWYKLAVSDSLSILGLAIRSPLKGKTFRCVSSFTITYSSDQEQWQALDGGVTMGRALENGGKVQKVMFQNPLNTMFLRIHPKTAGALTIALIVPETRPTQKITYPTAVVKRPLSDDNTAHTQVLYPHAILHQLEMDSLDPVVFQEYVRPRGAVLTQYRCVYKAFADSYGYVLSHKHSLTDSDGMDANTRFLISQDSSREFAVMSLRPNACGEMLEKTRALLPLVAPLVRNFGELETLVTDWIRDKNDKWWLLQVKAWRVRPHLSAFYGLSAPMNTETPFGAVAAATTGTVALAGGDDANAAEGDKRRGQHRKAVEPPQQYRMCGMCRVRGDHQTEVTVKMMHLAVEALKIKGEWDHAHTLPPEDRNNGYQTVHICDDCYTLYKEQKASFKEEQELARAMGHVLSKALLTTSAINSKELTNQALLVPQRIGEKHGGDVGSIIQSASLGKRYELRHHELPRQWQLMLFFESIHQLPLRYLPDPVAAASQPDYQPPSLSLRVNDLLGAQDVVPLHLTTSTEPSAIPLNVLKIRSFYTGPHEDSPDPANPPRLHEKVAAFLNRQRQVVVSLCEGDEPIGVARFPLLQLVSNMTPMVELTRIFSSVSLGTCSLRVRLGMVQSHLRYTKDEYPVFHEPSGLYVPCCPSYTISALPRDWKRVVAAGINAGRGADGLHQLAIEDHAGEGDDGSTAVAGEGTGATAAVAALSTSGISRMSSTTEPQFDMWATATQQVREGGRGKRARGSASTAASATPMLRRASTPGQAAARRESGVAGTPGAAAAAPPMRTGSTVNMASPAEDDRVKIARHGSLKAARAHAEQQHQLATRDDPKPPKFNKLPYFLDPSGGRAAGAPAEVIDHANAGAAEKEAAARAKPSRLSIVYLLKERKQAAMMLESLTARERLSKYQAWSERHSDAALRKDRNRKVLQQKRARRAKTAKKMSALGIAAGLAVPNQHAQGAATGSVSGGSAGGRTPRAGDRHKARASPRGSPGAAAPPADWFAAGALANTDSSMKKPQRTGGDSPTSSNSALMAGSTTAATAAASGQQRVSPTRTRTTSPNKRGAAAGGGGGGGMKNAFATASPKTATAVTTKSALARRLPAGVGGDSAPKPYKKLQFSDAPVTLINPEGSDEKARASVHAGWDLGNLRKRGGGSSSRSFMAWKIDVSIRSIQGGFAAQPNASYLAKYSLFGEDVACEGFGVTDQVPVSFEREDTTYLFCLNNKTVLKYFKDLNQRVRVSIGSPFGDFQEAYHTDLDFTPITDAIANKKHPPVLDVLYHLKKTQRLLTGGEDGDNLVVENMSEPSSDDEYMDRAIYREKPDDVASSASSSGEEDEEESELDSDIGHHPLLECMIAATPIDLDIGAVTILRDLRPNYDIAIVSTA